MEQELEQIREQQKASWDKFSPGWKKWDSLMMDFLKPMANEIISLLNPKPNDIVLDVAAGTGEPGLTIASMLDGGKVIITDLSDEMLEIAKENALLRGIENVETIACDVSELPFVDNTFDAISCRFGFMFFPDMKLAASEMFRVLKPGGKIATAVWNVAPKNFWVTSIMGAINKNMELPPPKPDAPGMFRCAPDGMLAGLFSEVGFKNVSQSEITSKLKAGSTDTFWTIMTEVAAPIATALSKADDAMQNKIKREVYQLFQEKYPDGNVIIDASALVVSGQK